MLADVVENKEAEAAEEFLIHAEDGCAVPLVCRSTDEYYSVMGVLCAGGGWHWDLKGPWMETIPVKRQEELTAIATGARNLLSPG